MNSQERIVFDFAPAKPFQRELLHHWFEQKHVKEWMHGVGLQNTLNGLEKFFRGESTTTYWIGYDQEVPFAFLITAPGGEDAITLDIFICDVRYLGKGLAAPMIMSFLTRQFSHVKRVLIDPEATNTRAIHIYQKVGFKITGEFIASWHPVPHYQMELNMEELLTKNMTNDPKKSLFIRPLTEMDIPKIVSRYSFPWSTPEKTQALWDSYYQEQQGGIRTVAVLEANHEILGYGSLLRKPESPFFAQKNIPEINAIWIDEDHRRQGLGTALIQWLERLASLESYQQIGIGVGLYKDYGPAQKLYFELGYSPDGNGITYKGESTIPGESYPLDDDLILWLTKQLTMRHDHA